MFCTFWIKTGCIGSLCNVRAYLKCIVHVFCVYTFIKIKLECTYNIMCLKLIFYYKFCSNINSAKCQKK